MIPLKRTIVVQKKLYVWIQLDFLNCYYLNPMGFYEPKLIQSNRIL